MSKLDLERDVERIRAFNRFYTQRIGVIRKFDGDLSLPAARVLFEIAQSSADGCQPAGADLAQTLGLDAGYVSRLLQELERKNLLRRERSPRDKRRWDLTLTDAGNRFYDALTQRTRSELSRLIEPLSAAQRRQLIEHMESIAGLLQSEASSPKSVPCVLREHRSGDLGWVICRHGALYAAALGLDDRFEALVASIVAEFGKCHDPRRERLWIAEQGGEPVGSIMLVAEGDRVARLRLFLVEPSTRGTGLGNLLIETLLAFARGRGYEAIALTTLRELPAAHRLYKRIGFSLIHSSKPQKPWGPTVHQEEWRLDLT